MTFFLDDSSHLVGDASYVILVYLLGLHGVSVLNQSSFITSEFDVQHMGVTEWSALPVGLEKARSLNKPIDELTLTVETDRLLRVEALSFQVVFQKTSLHSFPNGQVAQDG